MGTAHRGFSIGLVQMAAGGDAAARLDAARAGVREAAARGADVICLPELFRSPYFCQREDPAAFDLAEPVPGPSTAALGETARETGAVIVAPLFERRARGLYHNTVAVLGPDGATIGLYRKMHIPDDPGYVEKFYFTPGDTGFRAFDTPFGRIGVLVCWDQWFPEAARLVALRGADVIFCPTAIGWLPGERDGDGPAQRDAWRTAQRAHAIANGVYLAAVNRAGTEKAHPAEPGIAFWGSSFAADPQGIVLAEAGPDGEAVLVARVEPARIEEVRRAWPFLRDRRVDAYGGLTERFLDA